MIDLETMGNKPGSALVAIGTVKFDSDKAYDGFYEKINLESCQSVGLNMDADTVLWWMRQSPEARNEFNQAGCGMHIAQALDKLNLWINAHHKSVHVWGNGADFDQPLLKAAYNACVIKLPWEHYNSRCYRTIKNLFPHVRISHVGTKHNAVSDAHSQAEHLINMLKLNGLPLQ